MRFNILRAILIVALLSTSSFGQGQRPGNVLVMTGRAWVILPELNKLTYIQGLKDGIMIAATYLDGEERNLIIDTAQAKGFFPGDYVKELDSLYRDRENLPIPMPFAYQYVNLKLKGTATKEELERKLVELRKALAKYQ